jgi:hypothetical protein
MLDGLPYQARFSVYLSNNDLFSYGPFKLQSVFIKPLADGPALLLTQ